jgi:cytochrome c biogenesis protein CcmG/thiol:disulfide interchange protein DsbE
MNRQTKLRKSILIAISVLGISVVGGFAIFNGYSAETKNASAPSLQDIVKSAETWGAAFTSWTGKDAPNLTVEDIESRTHKLSDYRGRDVLVVFWATWCPACNAEIPHLIELRKIFPQEKLAILAISNEQPEHLKHFAAAKKINYSVASSDVGALPAPFSSVTSIPATFFIDRKGVIKLAAEGLVSLEETKAIIQAEQ